MHLGVQVLQAPGQRKVVDPGPQAAVEELHPGRGLPHGQAALRRRGTEAGRGGGGPPCTAPQLLPLRPAAAPSPLHPTPPHPTPRLSPAPTRAPSVPPKVRCHQLPVCKGGRGLSTPQDEQKVTCLPPRRPAMCPAARHRAALASHPAASGGMLLGGTTPFFAVLVSSGSTRARARARTHTHTHAHTHRGACHWPSSPIALTMTYCAGKGGNGEI